MFFVKATISWCSRDSRPSRYYTNLPPSPAPPGVGLKKGAEAPVFLPGPPAARLVVINRDAVLPQEPRMVEGILHQLIVVRSPACFDQDVHPAAAGSARLGPPKGGQVFIQPWGQIVGFTRDMLHVVVGPAC